MLCHRLCCQDPRSPAQMLVGSKSTLTTSKVHPEAPLSPRLGYRSSFLFLLQAPKKRKNRLLRCTEQVILLKYTQHLLMILCPSFQVVQDWRNLWSRKDLCIGGTKRVMLSRWQPGCVSRRFRKSCTRYEILSIPCSGRCQVLRSSSLAISVLTEIKYFWHAMSRLFLSQWKRHACLCLWWKYPLLIDTSLKGLSRLVILQTYIQCCSILPLITNVQLVLLNRYHSIIFEQAVEERQKWARFGDALKAGEQQSVTAQSTDEIPFERVRQQKQTQEERKQDLKNVLQGSDKGAIVSK